MSDLRDYYLQNLGIGEVWKTREIPVQAEDAKSQENIVRSAPLASLAEAKSVDVLAPSLEQPKIFLNSQEINTAIQSCAACRLCERFGRSQLATAPTTVDILLISEFSAPMQLDAQEKLIQNLMMALPLPLLSKKPIQVYRSALIKASAPSSADVVAAVDEVATCISYLKQEIDLIRPRAIFLLGNRVAEGLLGLPAEIKLSEFRSTQHFYQNVPVIATYSAHELMTEPSRKAEVWSDICKLMDLLA